ncbi:hypothetical protein [Subtercola endophyticus]|uniref:hypothetical protein n=1 Tax=Subtercola endophyticus TaxID=2895559 RepID=UPI001E45E2F0|nr:hypothetical protein [Subtercola endophyticus]UFS59214.1 hypothetical protein LQ955_19930 [Subtercola endophyticus]
MVGVVVGLAVGAIVAFTGIAVTPQTARADASSAVTVTAASQDTDLATAPFPKLSVTVSQTRDLTSQGIQVSWTGAAKSEVPSGQTGGTNFFQIAQCWGADNDTQPDRTKCQYGAFGTPGDSRDSLFSDASPATEDVAYTAPSRDLFNPAYTAIPFLSATGVTVSSIKDGVKDVNVNVNSNQFFTQQTTNEVSWAGSGTDGTGSAKFEVQTAAQSPGLGCGARVVAADGTATGTSCWLVLIPRGTADAGGKNITGSGLFYDAWKHRIAVKLSFKPLGVSCTIGAAERQLSGSELIAGAVASWQPALCGAAGGSAYTMLSGSESDAALAANGTDVQPLALTSRALSIADVPDKLEYAPVALTGVSIGFAIDREPSAFGDIPASAQDSARLPFTSLNLTPRLVAKLLTNSYLDSLPTGADKSELGYKSPTDPGKNARNLTLDPDFLAVNDKEWQYQNITSPSLADLLEPQGRSDAAYALWSYVLSDAEAVKFLQGQPDPYGMIVNPWSSTDATVNPSKTGLSLPRDNFPKADPVEQPKDPAGPAAVNLVTWRPYTNDFDTSAYLILRGDGQILGAWDGLAATPKYTKAARALAGLQRVVGVTDTASAAKYQVFSASLQNAAGKFVAPTTASLTAAASAMTVDQNQTQVSEMDSTSAQAKAAAGAYPLAMPVYAAVNPALSDAPLRADYAAFIRYAAGAGQESGTGLGQLPDGYAPIPDSWKKQALAAADVIEAGPQPVPTPTPSASSVAAPAAAAPAATTTYNAPAYSVPQSAAQQAPAAAGAAAATPADPSASGAAAAPPLGDATPADNTSAAISAAVPASILAGLGAAFAVPFVGRFRRRF